MMEPLLLDGKQVVPVDEISLFLRRSGYLNRNQLFELAFEILRAIERDDVKSRLSH